MRNVIRVVLCIAIAAASSACHATLGSNGDLTVINRTTAEVVVSNGNQELRVPACDERTVQGFGLNGWTLTSAGRDTFKGGNSAKGPASYILVTDVPTQTDTRPSSLPPCSGLLQRG